ncbi:MAG: PSD1 and planctomycete cytochrome C domain-containing protein [Isosphaeraceae bacterium]|nr:PSD1 and planctomycete cytochrome C domain-containing protein [Isosphaeraceae bacterium]
MMRERIELGRGRGRWGAAAAIAIVASWSTPGIAADDPAADSAREHVERFEKEVRPILVARCLGCHGPEKQKGGLRLDSRAAVMSGGDSGPAVVPGSLEESRLVEAIRYGDELQMPPKSKLPADEIAALERWVAAGAHWTAESAEAKVAAKAFDLAARAKHWAFRPVVDNEPPTPGPALRGRVSTEIDRYLLAALEAKGLGYAPEADRATLIRRLAFDLTGLPPTPAEIAAFENDPAPDAYAALVERLLASPRYGERWGRKWLDLTRFAETAGHEFDYDIPFAWRYRDYVVRAFNDDVPYDRFVLEHLAGDLLPDPRSDPADGANLSVQGTAFFMLGEGTHSPVDVREEQQRRTDNQIEVFGKTFLSLTIACARCHDHKFDPMTQRDYYALAGIFESSRHQYAAIDDPAPRLAALADLARAKSVPLTVDRARFEVLLPEALAELGKPAPAALSRSTVFETFDAGWEGWRATGEAFGDGPTEAGDRRLEGERLAALPTGWAHSGRFAPGLAGVLRSKTFTIERPFIQLRVLGKNSLIQVVVDGFEKNRDPIYGPLIHRVNSPDRPNWVVIDASMWKGHVAYLEISDGGAVDFRGPRAQLDEPSGEVAVDEIRFSDAPAIEEPVAPRFPSQFAPAPNEPRTSWSDRLVDVIETGCVDGAARGLIDWAAERGAIARLLPKDDAGRARLAEIRRIESRLGTVRRIPAFADGTGRDVALLVRGQAKTPGPAVPRRFLEVFDGAEPWKAVEGSGRLELARRVVDPRNPLLARSIVNRIWKGHFGEGLVRSTDDFGVMGETPSSPELLDRLASIFMREGWSIKRLHRLIVLSSAYRQSSRSSDPRAAMVDADNRLLHRFRVRRLEAEEIRDTLLAISKRLDPAMGGPGVPPHLTPFMEGRGRPSASGPLDGAGRRSIYLEVRRNFLSPLLLVFDFPIPATTMGRRNVSNVPAQALALLNDPFVLEQSRLWSTRIASAPVTDSERLELAYLEATGRRPSAAESAAALAFLSEVRASDGEASAWSELCHALINTKAFTFVE